MYTQIERPVLTVVSDSELAPEVNEAFVIATTLSERGFSVIKGDGEHRHFQLTVNELQITLRSVCRIALTRSKKLHVATAKFTVVDLDDSSEMELYIHRDSAKAVSLDTDFDQGLLDHFRAVA